MDLWGGALGKVNSLLCNQGVKGTGVREGNLNSLGKAAS